MKEDLGSNLHNKLNSSKCAVGGLPSAHRLI